MDNLINPNGPDEEAHHNAFLVDTGEFDRAAEILMARNIRIVKYSDEAFPDVTSTSTMLTVLRLKYPACMKTIRSGILDIKPCCR